MEEVVLNCAEDSCDAGTLLPQEADILAVCFGAAGGPKKVLLFALLDPGAWGTATFEME
jgi:hypothetical protein